MQALQKKLKGLINASIGASVVFLILGIFLIAFPVGFLNILRWTIAIISLGAGVWIVASEFSRRTMSPMFGLTTLGVILITIGLIFAINPGATGIFAIVLGIWFIVSSIAGLRFSVALSGNAALTSAILAILSFICGLLLILNPWGGAIDIAVLMGIIMVIYAISCLIDTVVLKQNLKDLSKAFKKYAKKIEEAEVVKKKK